MSQEVVTQLERIVEDFEAATIPAGTSALDRAVEQISSAFRVRQDEVAILVLIGEGKILQFLIPEKLKGIGTIPLTSTKALAARTVREKRPELINKFNAAPHASVFEGVPLEELGIAVRTVETHRAKIMLKLGLHSVTELVHYAIRNEIISPREF